MSIISQIVFALACLICAFLFYKRGRFIYRNIKLGKSYEGAPDSSLRLKNMFLVAFGQKKMFKNVIPAVLHLFIYGAFVITQIELIEIVIDGLTGHHRILYHLFEGSTLLTFIYRFAINFIEFASVLALIATIAFLWRRNLLKIPRFHKPEMKGWPTLDANLILLFELYLVSCIFLMNSTDQALHHNSYGFVLSGMLASVWKSVPEGVLHVLERVGWWGHILGVMFFLVYVTYSKHLHIMLAFPNTYFGRQKPKGYIDNLGEVSKEIKLMMNHDTAFAAPAETEVAELPTFGAKDVFDLSWKNLLDAYSCTECGRCTAACPANITGKKLSPRKIMMDTRDRLEEVGKQMEEKKGKWEDDGKSLIENGYISVEELRACTTCNACVEECPVMISPLEIIIQLRRNLILEQSNSPDEWNNMFSNIENNAAPWQFSQMDRANWINEG